MSFVRLVAASRLALLLTWGLLGAVAAVGAPEARRMEAVGAAGLVSSEPGEGSPRDRARFAAVRRALRRMALELVPEARRPAADREDPESWVEGVLGPDPFAYATRFRILDDRGERPALLTPDAETEYVVVVEVYLDETRVRERLSSQGLLPDPPPEDRNLLMLEVEVDSYAALRELRETLLAARGVHRAQALELSRGRVLLAVEAEVEAEPLLTGLLRRTPPELQVELLAVADRRARLRIDWVESGAPAVAPGALR